MALKSAMKSIHKQIYKLERELAAGRRLNSQGIATGSLLEEDEIWEKQKRVSTKASQSRTPSARHVRRGVVRERGLRAALAAQSPTSAAHT